MRIGADGLAPDCALPGEDRGEAAGHELAAGCHDPSLEVDAEATASRRPGQCRGRRNRWRRERELLEHAGARSNGEILAGLELVRLAATLELERLTKTEEAPTIQRRPRMAMPGKRTRRCHRR